MLSINTNTSSLMAQNNLNQTQNSLTASMERLSTGLRINSASDDAAGLQISNRMNTEIKGMDVAMRNANDAISMAQTAEGAMVETTNMLNRMRDLSLQAANGSNTAEDRKAMQDEVNQLVSQINDTASQTNFAGINLLNGDASSLSFQVGSNAGETISFGIGNMSSSSLKGDVTSANLDSSAILTAVNKNPLPATDNEKGLVLTLENNDTSKADTVIKVDISAAATDGTTGDTNADALVKEINKNNDLKALGLEAGVDDSGNIVLTGDNLKEFKDISVATSAVAAGTSPTSVATQQDIAISATPKSVADINLSTQAGAQQAIQILDGALEQVDKERANLGAVQNRLDYTVANLQNTQENLNTSMSRIKDVDFAKETTNMTKNQMMMQAGNTVLAQTKQMPQYAIQLLG
ncbi:flagellin [Spongorhabdus nitratireducens]